MTSKQIELIDNSWDFVILNTQKAGLIFYIKLFSFFLPFFRMVVNPRKKFAGPLKTDFSKLRGCLVKTTDPLYSHHRRHHHHSSSANFA